LSILISFCQGFFQWIPASNVRSSTLPKVTTTPVCPVGTTASESFIRTAIKTTIKTAATIGTGLIAATVNALVKQFIIFARHFRIPEITVSFHMLLKKSQQSHLLQDLPGAGEDDGVVRQVEDALSFDVVFRVGGIGRDDGDERDAADLGLGDPLGEQHAV